MKHTIFYFLMAIVSCFIVSCDNNSETSQKQITTVRAFNGKTLYDSILLYRGMTKEYFINNFGSPSRFFDNPQSSLNLDISEPVEPIISNPPTKEQLDRKQIYDNEVNKGQFKVYVYDNLGLSFFTYKHSDTILFIEFLTKEKTSSNEPTSRFKGLIILDTITIDGTRIIDKLKTCENLTYYCYNVKKDIFSGQVYDQDFSVFFNPATNEISRVQLNFRNKAVRNQLGWQLEDIYQLQDMLVKQITPELKGSGYSERKIRDIAICFTDKVSNGIVSGKYQEMEEGARLELNMQIILDCMK